jgi:hypothetical protein
MGMRTLTTLRARGADVPTTEGCRPASVAAKFAGGLLGAWLPHEGVRPNRDAPAKSLWIMSA